MLDTLKTLCALDGVTGNEDKVREYIKDLPYEVVAAPNGDCRVKINGKEYSPEEISAKIIAKVKKDASAYLGEDVKEIVVTVPAYFNDS